MKIPSVPSETRRVYENAVRFKQLRPWETMQDSDLFGVHDPVNGRTGYCCMMGALGQMLAHCVYRGGEGLAICRRMLAGDFEREPGEMAAAQYCLMGEFADRSSPAQEDLATIRPASSHAITQDGGCRGTSAPAFAWN